MILQGILCFSSYTQQLVTIIFNFILSWNRKILGPCTVCSWPDFNLGEVLILKTCNCWPAELCARTVEWY